MIPSVWGGQIAVSAGLDARATEGRVRSRADARGGWAPWSGAGWVLVESQQRPFLLGPQACATEGRVRPRGDACDDCSSRFMGQEHLTRRVLRRCKGVLPWGRSDAARRAKALDSGPGVRFDWKFARLASHQPRATKGRVRPRGDASDDCSSRFMGQNTPRNRVLKRCKGVLPCGRSDAARRAYALDSGPGGRSGRGFARLASSQPIATQGRVGPRGDACDVCTSRFMGQEHLTLRVLRRCRGVVLVGGPLSAIARAIACRATGRGPANSPRLIMLKCRSTMAPDNFSSVSLPPARAGTPAASSPAPDRQRPARRSSAGSACRQRRARPGWPGSPTARSTGPP